MLFRSPGRQANMEHPLDTWARVPGRPEIWELVEPALFGATKLKSANWPGTAWRMLSKGLNMGQGWVPLASALRRQRRTSISNSSPFSSFAWASKTRGGCRALSTYSCQTCGEKRDSSVRAWRPSSAVFSIWHEAQIAWNSCFCPRTVCRRGVA